MRPIPSGAGQHRSSDATAALLAELVEMVADGSLELPIADTFPPEQVRDV
jgi:hypothetical protein